MFDEQPELRIAQVRLHVVDDSGIDNHFLVVTWMGCVVMGWVHGAREGNRRIERQIAVPTTDDPISTQAAANGAPLVTDAVLATVAERFPRFRKFMHFAMSSSVE
jgi:hypothetical protein